MCHFEYKLLTKIYDFMPVEEKYNILSRHPYLRLRLTHAAIGSFPCHISNNMMMVNRLITVFADSGATQSSISDSVSGEKFVLRPGYFYFVPCNHPSDWDLSPNLLFVSLHFNLEMFYGFDVFRDYSRCFQQQAPELTTELKDLIHHDEEIITLCRLNEIIFNLCVQLLAKKPEPLRTDTGKWHNYEKVFTFIQKNGDATTRVETLADIMNMRNNVFSRKFTRDLGITPKNFLLNMLTRKASEMLLVPGTTVRQAAERLNFSSEYYFSNFFKKQTGLPPKEFQRHNGV